MALFPTRFPTSISYHLVGGPVFSTDIGRGTAVRAEERNINWSTPACYWELPLQNLSQAEFDEFYALFLLLRGRAYSILLLDWQDFEAVDSFLGVGDGAETEFQLLKNYDAFSAKFPITDKTPGAGGEICFDGDYTWSIGAGDFFFAEDYDDHYYVVASVAYAGGKTRITVVTDCVVPDMEPAGTVNICFRRTTTKIAATDETGAACGVSVSVNGVAKTEDTHYKVDYTTGIVDFATGSSPLGAPPSGHVILASFMFEKIVRLDTDKMDSSLDFHNIHNVSIPVLEVDA